MTVKRRTQLMIEPDQYRDLQALAKTEGMSVSSLVREAVDLLLRQRRPVLVTQDPIWAIVGLAEGRDLIDGIPVSEDPDLYYLANLMKRKGVGPYSAPREEPPPAWEIDPRRYACGEDGQAVRIEETGR
jgi:hypothetical protein